MTSRVPDPMGSRHRMASWLPALVLGLCLSACEAPAPPSEPVVKRVKTMVVEARAGELERHFSGRVVAANTALLSFSVSGTVSDVLVKAGDTVKRGQLLATMDSRPLALEAEGARADLRKAQSVLAQRNNTLRRNQELLAKGFIGEATIEQNQADVAAARSDVAYRQSRLSRAQLSLGDTKLTAPFAGVVGERFVQPNEEVAAGGKVMTLLEETRLEVEVSVPEIAIARVTAGTKAQVRFSAVPSRTFDGAVREIGRVAGAGNLFPVKVALDAPPGNLRAGMTADVVLMAPGPAEELAGYLVPITALKPGDVSGQGHVFVFDADAGVARMVPIMILSVRDNNAVVTGVEPGARVIVAGVAFLSDGQSVLLMTPAAN